MAKAAEPFLNHIVQINADRYTPTDTGLIPTGKLETVAATPLDFTKPATIGSRIETDNVQLKNGKGSDQNFVLNINHTNDLTHAATVTGDKSEV